MPGYYRIALNRLTFGARDTEETKVNLTGLDVWFNDQINAPPGDDPDLAAHLAAQTMPIRYNPGDPAQRQMWQGTNEVRGLNYVNYTPAQLWEIHRTTGTATAPDERTRVRQELAAATWIRNTHSRYQLREFMVDFWHNHFNISKTEAESVTVLLPAFDRVAIRANAFGNFRTLLEATATSGAMLIYLDNYASSATTPNENYAREIMELHTMGGEAYLGVGDTDSVRTENGVPIGFTDKDVLQASRALSGWTISLGQSAVHPNNGTFFYNPLQHNTNAGVFLGRDLSTLRADMEQGRAVLDAIARHPATARHVVGRLVRRIFGDRPPTPAYERGVAAFMAHRDAPDQMARVLRAIVIDGEEIFFAPVAKVRRPYERIIAMLRTTDSVLTAGTTLLSALDGLGDGLFAWPAPDGRPDNNDYWLATGANFAAWNIMFQAPNWREVQTTLTAQTPVQIARSATQTVEYWVNRMVGGKLAPENMNVLIGDQAGADGAPTAIIERRSAASIENAYRRLIGLIATSDGFSLR